MPPINASKKAKNRFSLTVLAKSLAAGAAGKPAAKK
jgi:hypothetical protein